MNINQLITLQNQPAPSTQEDNHQNAEVQVLAILNQIVSDAERQVKMNLFLRKNLMPYSNFKTMISVNEVNSLLKLQILPKDTHKQEQQPKPLLIDSLLPISADIDPENQYKKKISKRNLLEQSSVRVKLRDKESTTDNKEKYKRLQITEVSQEDGFTKQLRKAQHQKNQKVQAQRKINEEKQKLRIEKLKDKKKEEKFSYDYNGEVIQLKLENKANLVSKLVNGATEEKMVIIKEAINDPHPTRLQGVNPNKKVNKKLQNLINPNALKKREQVQFSDVKSLADNIDTTNGVKYVYQGKTFEQKKRVVSTIELKKSLSQRKISKQQYMKLRELNNNNREQLQQSLKKSSLKSNQIQSQRVHSQMKFNYGQKKSRETIHVTNLNLREKMMEKVIHFQQPYSEEMQKTQDSQFQLGTINSYNMEYMKTGGSLPMSTSKQFFGKKNTTQLPKIMHTTLYSHTKPKGREKLKQANEILREMRKRFQQKLRV